MSTFYKHIVYKIQHKKRSFVQNFENAKAMTFIKYVYNHFTFYMSFKYYVLNIVTSHTSFWNTHSGIFI